MQDNGETASQPVTRKKTYCKFCVTACGLIAEVQGDRVLKVKGDPEHPLTGGYTCPKGRATGQAHHDPKALLHPLMRKGGELVEVSWDEALDDIASRLRHLIDTRGPHSIGCHFGAGLGQDSCGYTMASELNAALEHGPRFSNMTVDCVAKVLVAGAMGGFPGLNAKTDYEACKLLLFIGTNPMVSHAHNTGIYNPAVWLKTIARRGEVWTIDPLRTETAKFATRHVAPYPGKDYAILAWLVREIIDGGPLDPQQPLNGLDVLREALEGYDLETAAAVAGVAQTDLTDLLAAVRKYGKTVIETGTGISMSVGCNMTQWFAWLVMILTGAMNRVGGAWFHPSFRNQFDTFELPVSEPWTPGPTVRPDIPGIIGEWPCAVLADEIEAGNIRGLFNFGGRMLRNFPDTKAIEAALLKLELNVMFEIGENETSATCTHVLPTKDSIERVEITVWDTLEWNNHMQLSEQLVEPMGERRSAWWVISEIMRRAGLPVPDHVPESDLAPDADEQMLRHLMANARCGFDELREKKYVEAPLELPARWVDAHFERIGGWKLVPERFLAQWHELRAADKAALGKARPFCFTPRRQRKKMNAQLDFLGAENNILINPADAREHGIVDGSTIQVSTERGSIKVIARIDDGIRQGVASLAHGHGEGNVNLLTSKDILDSVSGMVLYSGVPVTISAIEPADRD